MNETCKAVRIAAMARDDGEPSPLPVTDIEAHVQGCAACREAIGAGRVLHGRLASAHRRMPAVSLWPAIEQRVTSDRGGRWWAALVALALAYKLLELSPIDLGIGLKLVAVAIVVAGFVVLRANPFVMPAEI
jgi:predicted anti-sigma-YlaC factor YlaD